MAVRIQYRRDTIANWTSVNPILAQGEVGLELDTSKIKVGNGSTAWNSLGYSQNTIYNGSGAPSNSIGGNGDFYIDNTNHYFYGPKASGSWPSGFSVVGPQGATGPQGPQGPQGLNGPNLITSGTDCTLNGILKGDGSNVSVLAFTPEDIANKSINTALGTSDTLYPSQNAVKVYVDNGLATKQNSGNYITDLVGDVLANGPTSATATVVGINSATIPASAKVLGTNALKQLIDASSTTISNDTTGTAANLSGTPTLPNGTSVVTQAQNDNSQKIASTQYVDTSLGGYYTKTEVSNSLSNKVDKTTSISTSSPLQGGGNLTNDRTISITKSDSTTDGYLSSTDWNTFNNKQSSGNYITQLNGDVTGTGPGNTTTAISSNVVSNTKLSKMPAHTIKGNNTGSLADPIDLTSQQVTAELDNFVGDSGSGGIKGLVPAPSSGNAASNYVLKANGSWGNPVSVNGPITYNSGTIGIDAASSSSSGSMSSSDKNKLDGIASGATANSSDAYLLSRTNHTGTQSATTITGLAVVATSGDYTDLSSTPLNSTGTFSTGIKPALLTLTGTGTVTTSSIANYNTVLMTLTGNVTLGSFTSATNGQKIIIRVQQDGTGGKTLSVDTTYWNLGLDIPGTTINYSANKYTYIGAIYNSDTSKWDIISIVKGY
jgi:hypothetical protein